MCFLPCASRQGRPFWPPAGDHEGRPYGAFAPIRKDWEARMAYHILLVDDAPELRRMVGELLEGAGYAVTLAADCAQARRAWTESQPDAALLDVMLPDGDGFSLLEELRRVENCVPVLFLSARDEDEARLRGLGLGAANRGNIVTIDALCQALWEGPMVGYENTLMVHIRRLREKLETDPSHPQYLLTVRGLGYRLAQEERPGGGAISAVPWWRPAWWRPRRCWCWFWRWRGCWPLLSPLPGRAARGTPPWTSSPPP